jgi:hypothetical protein
MPQVPDPWHSTAPSRHTLPAKNMPTPHRAPSDMNADKYDIDRGGII